MIRPYSSTTLRSLNHFFDGIACPHLPHGERRYSSGGGRPSIFIPASGPHNPQALPRIMTCARASACGGCLFLLYCYILPTHICSSISVISLGHHYLYRSIVTQSSSTLLLKMWLLSLAAYIV
ncbi:hypothetical protein JB92DRAFT_2013728 [Gautieria morchelliformis]|nr:hypothetical protein JB92DRAFT_2013728 [Gautieria morchelliformis]